MNIGQRIKARRKELGISADELAKRLGKNRATVFRYENGDIENLPLDILEPIAKALNTTPAYIMGWQKVEKNNNQIADLVVKMRTDEDFMFLVHDISLLDEEKQKAVKSMVSALLK